jgi:hypothetical protein
MPSNYMTSSQSKESHRQQKGWLGQFIYSET